MTNDCGSAEIQHSVAELAWLARNLYGLKQKFHLLCTTIKFEYCTTSVDISMSVNIQCQQILLGIEELEKYLQEKLVREALDLDSNAETSRYKELLLRLKRSLAQYTEQDKRLVYVGFMGHFSTGKSSTINSLLGLKESSEKARRVGLNPVDKSITLITHDDNKDCIFSTTREGTVSIRSSLIDNELLRDLVIADTPGAGDPILAHEIAQDFLPICDLIIYFFSAAIPLDNADIPLLKEQSTQLSFIPIHFTITRADEFKSKHEDPFSENNFDREKSNLFLSELSSRVNHLFQGNLVLDGQSFTLVDNKTQFHIDELRNYLAEFVNTSNRSGQLNIHSHKILYFQSSAKKLQEFFCDFLSEKLISLRNILETAESNIQRFEGKIRLSNNTLTASWNEKLENINYIYKETSFSDVIHMSSLQSSIFEFSSQAFSPTYKYNFEKEYEAFFEQFKRDIILQSQKQLSTFVSNGKTNVNLLTTLSSATSPQSVEIDFSDFRIDIVLDKLNLQPPAILRLGLSSKTNELDENLMKIFDKLNRQVTDLRKNLIESRPIGEYQNIIKDACSSLARDFDDYFDSISVYRTSVFSLGVKEATAKLGLGRQMDMLEAKFTDEQTQIIKQDAQTHVFPDSFNIFQKNLQEISRLKADTEKLQAKLKTIQALKTAWSSNIYSEDESLKLISPLKSDLATVTTNHITKVQEAMNDDIHILFREYNEKWLKEVDSLKVIRRKRLLIFAVSFGLVGLAGYVLYVFGRQSEPANNIFMTSILGVVTNIVSSLIGWIFAKVTDQFPINIKSSESNLLAEIRNDYSSLVDMKLASLDEVFKFDKRLILSIWNDLLIQNPKKDWENRREDFYTSLRPCLEEFLELHNQSAIPNSKTAPATRLRRSLRANAKSPFKTQHYG
jgi:predicted GTPase